MPGVASKTALRSSYDTGEGGIFELLSRSGRLPHVVGQTGIGGPVI